MRISDLILPAQEDRITSSLRENPRLLGQMVFSPRPVLVEGQTDSAALAIAVSRLHPANPEVPSQTDFVVCGGCNTLALWFEIAQKMRIDFRAVADLDALFVPDIQRVMDNSGNVRDRIATQFMEASPTIRSSLAPISQAIGKEAAGELSPRLKADWLARRLKQAEGAANSAQDIDYASQRTKALLDILRQNGLWLLHEGTLEDLLAIQVKDVPHARDAASIPGAIDEVARWAAFEFDLHGDVGDFLRSACENIAQRIQFYVGRSPNAGINQILQAVRPGDHRLVDIVQLDEDKYRITVKGLEEFAGYWLEFSRATAPLDMKLSPPH